MPHPPKGVVPPALAAYHEKKRLAKEQAVHDASDKAAAFPFTAEGYEYSDGVWSHYKTVGGVPVLDTDSDPLLTQSDMPTQSECPEGCVASMEWNPLPGAHLAAEVMGAFSDPIEVAKTALAAKAEKRRDILLNGRAS